MHFLLLDGTLSWWGFLRFQIENIDNMAIQIDTEQYRMAFTQFVATNASHGHKFKALIITEVHSM